MRTVTTRIILDTDLGMGVAGTEIDDGFAFALAHADPAIQIDLITTVAGNTDVETATLLTMDMAERLHSDAPVVSGAAKALMAPHPAPHATAETRRDYGRHLVSSMRAAEEIVRHVMAHPGKITLVAIGPMTNIAVALCLEPRLAATLREIVVMGGKFFGQTHQTGMPGEFNVWSDPEAAQIVANSGAVMRWVGLDVTELVRVTREHAAELSRGAGAFAPFASEYTVAWIERQAREEPGDPRSNESCAMHDPLVVAAVTRPELLTWQPAAVSVVTGDGVARGVTIADLLITPTSPPANCQIATDVDVDGFMSYFLQQISGL